MKELQLIKSEKFGEVECNFYGDGKEIFVTREQIGSALDYREPRKAISDMHNRHKERLDKFSVVRKLLTTDGKHYNTTIYNAKGVMEICRWSSQPKANEFMDWAWDIIDSLRKGETKVVSMTEYQKMVAQTRIENVKVRKAHLLEKMAEQYDGTTYKQVLQSYATKELTGEHLIPLPKLENKTYTATDLGEILGVSANKIGILANKHNLKTDEYGQWFKDKAKGCHKEVPTFRYYENVIPVLESLIAG